MKVLCTGAAGFIGSHVVDLLLKEGHEVLCLDDLSSGRRDNLPKEVDFHELNVASWYDLVAEFVDFEPETVIHLAAQPSICDSIDNPIRDGYVNVLGTLNVLRASQKIGVKRVVFSSTSAVYADIFSSLPLPEDWPCLPQSPYGISKLAAESYVRNLMPENGTVLRFGNVYGPRQVPLGENQVIPRMIRHFEEGAEFAIHGSGEQIRDFVYVEDVARAILLAMYYQESEPGTYNIASGRGVSVNRIAEIMADLYEVDGYEWEHDDQEDPRKKVELNVCMASDWLHWQPETMLEVGLAKTCEWWSKK